MAPESGVRKGTDISFPSQARIVEIQRFEALGRLAAGVAHDYNNLVAGILGYVSLLRELSSEIPEAAGYLATIESSARQAAELTARLLAASQRPSAPEPSIVNFLVDDAVALARGTLSRRAPIEKTLASDLPPVKVPQCLLTQAIVSLILLAGDMSGGKAITVLSRFDGDRNVCRESTSGGAVVVEISHAGSIDTGEKEALFRPFRPLPGGRDTGLALLASRAIAHSQGGSLDVRCEAGTVYYRISLPPCRP